MIDGMLQGMSLALSWPSAGYLLCGVVVGMWVGAVPGLGGVVGLILLLPFTYSLDPVPAFALLMGLYAVTSTSDTISAILLGIPGSVASQATILDGYPLAKQGQASRAFGAAYTVSAIGGIFGALFMAASLPFILPVIFAFGLPEFLMLAVLGLTMVGVLSGEAVGKGLLVAALGLLLTTVGYAEATGVPRYYLGIDYLLDGLPIVPIALGLFGLPELLEMAIKNTSISRIELSDARQGGMLRGIRDVLHHKWLTLRSAIIGVYVGILPGLGGAIVDWIAYGHAVQSAKGESNFGNGDIRGVIAPETANNASRAGALIPAVAFGIPGSLGAAILLGALVIKGLQPGPEMLTSNLDLTFSMIWNIAFANILAAGALMLLTRQIGKIAFLPPHSVVPGVVVVLLMGAWAATSSMGDWWVCLGMGVLGYLMKQGNWPRPPLILALVLGTLIENNYRLTMQVYDGYSWMYTQPIVVVLEVLIVVAVLLGIRGIARPAAVAKRPESATAQAEGLLSLGMSALFFGLFVSAYIGARAFEDADTALFPETVSLIAIPLALLVFAKDVRLCLVSARTRHGVGAAVRLAMEKWNAGGILRFFGCVVAILPITYLAGQLVALPAFVVLYLRLFGDTRWRWVVVYAVASAGVVWLIYSRLMNLPLHGGLLFD